MERKSIAFQIMLGLMCGSLGFGLSQLTIVGMVNQHEVKISGLENSTAQEREHNDKAITELVELVRTEIAQSTEAITLMKLQNQAR